jgi:hypothetical protein
MENLTYQIRNKIYWQIHDYPFSNHINYQTFHQVERMVNDQIRTRIYWQISNQVRRQIINQVRNQVLDEIKETEL